MEFDGFPFHILIQKGNSVIYIGYCHNVNQIKSTIKNITKKGKLSVVFFTRHGENESAYEGLHKDLLALFCFVVAHMYYYYYF